jgi:hypothetical protein
MMKKKEYIPPYMAVIALQTGNNILTISSVNSDLNIPFTGGGNGFSRAPGLFGVPSFGSDLE